MLLARWMIQINHRRSRFFPFSLFLLSLSLSFNTPPRSFSRATCFHGAPTVFSYFASPRDATAVAEKSSVIGPRDYGDWRILAESRISDIRISADPSLPERTRPCSIRLSLSLYVCVCVCVCIHLTQVSCPFPCPMRRARALGRIAEGFRYNVNNIRVTSTLPAVEAGACNEAPTIFRVSQYVALGCVDAL